MLERASNGEGNDWTIKMSILRLLRGRLHPHLEAVKSSLSSAISARVGEREREGGGIRCVGAVRSWLYARNAQCKYHQTSMRPRFRLQ